jgi:hypothetical protein
MLVIRVELHPAGGGAIEKLAELHIVNDGTATGRVGHYDVTAYEDGRAPRLGRVENYARLGGLPIYRLVWRALSSLGFGE